MEHYNERHRKSTFIGTGSHLTCEWWKLKDPVNMANAFSNFFTKITKKIKDATNKERRWYLNSKRLISFKHPHNNSNPNHWSWN
jgi:hypothetical protein